jgi:phosphoserine aminotransferase
MQGGGLGENAIVPMNLSRGKTADFVITGSWSIKSQKEAQRYCDCAHRRQQCRRQSHAVAGSFDLATDAKTPRTCTSAPTRPSTVSNFRNCPISRPSAASAPLVIDFSSHVASRSIDWSRVGLAFGGAQKNLGPAGLTLVFVRDDLLGQALDICPSAFNYKTSPTTQSMYNTPPTWGIYMAGLTFQWLLQQAEGALTGIAAMEQRNIAKANLALRIHRRFRLLREQDRPELPLAHERAFLPARRKPEREPSWPVRGRPACCSSRATSRSAACARASTTPCRWKAYRHW